MLASQQDDEKNGYLEMDVLADLDAYFCFDRPRVGAVYRYSE